MGKFDLHDSVLVSVPKKRRLLKGWFPKPELSSIAIEQSSWLLGNGTDSAAKEGEQKDRFVPARLWESGSGEATSMMYIDVPIIGD